jgi:hypothetical protein
MAGIVGQCPADQVEEAKIGMCFFAIPWRLLAAKSESQISADGFVRTDSNISLKGRS